jgi:hypothetical protein
MTKICSLCGEQAPFLFRQKVLKKYDASYFQCSRCDLIQTEEPFWLKEAPWPAIAALDTGAVSRNRLCRRLTLALSYALGLNPASRCLDYSGGSGLFVRMMRDEGFDFRWHDLYASNQFAKGFEGRVDAKYDLLTCFEVFEHFAAPGEELDLVFGPQHDFVFVSTLLHNGHKEGWWYYCPEAGGHVSFYSRRTMEHLGQRHGYAVLCGPDHTLFIRRDISLTRRRWHLLASFLNGSEAADLLLRWRPRYTSLVGPDYLHLRDRFIRGDSEKIEPSAQASDAERPCVSLPLSRKRRVALWLVEQALLASAWPVTRLSRRLLSMPRRLAGMLGSVLCRLRHIGKAPAFPRLEATAAGPKE